MDPYQHTIGRALLEMRDINDGQSADWRDKSRYQYVTANGIVFERRLPPGQTPRKKPLLDRPADRWREEEHTGPFVAIADPPPGLPISDWMDGLMPRWREWARPHGIDAQIIYRRNVITVDLPDWPQAVTCPDCGDLIVWDEAGAGWASGFIGHSAGAEVPADCSQDRLSLPP